ncbi:hypothetical protein LPTSP4_14320 [Leptospira ryugenii]|uniref:NAD glycohydrolase translocation F5/8 type C domain-containing protein n=1 Tax=Leptospira ryugenii TaxID=1917863 RepID=A0A2P2DZ57_9LEPT|nr:discoidin domain-containing protein [Leptospira ryugenii]GBF49912.1 hypothetical protein LPTSP4_14320 [Leptospira ryugenii]
MKSKLLKVLLFTLIVLFGTNCGKKISISMVTSTSMDNGLPFLVLAGKEWKAEPGAEFVKLHFYADEPFVLSKVSIESCSGSFKDRIAAYVNFDEVYASTDVEKSNSDVVFEPAVSARSLTLNFQRNTDICLKSVAFYDEKQKKYRPIIPEIVTAKVTASETASPETSYSAMNLFDSKYENGYATAKGAVGVSLQFDFDSKQKIDQLKIWNGYQRSDVHCIKNGRVKEFTLTGDDGYSETVNIEDAMGSQEIKLTKPFSGKSLKLTVNSIYPGYSEKGFVISELRFGNGGDWIAVDTLAKSQATAKQYFADFTAASLRNVLNRGLTGGEAVEPEVSPVTDMPAGASSEVPVDAQFEAPSSSDWTLRLRSDGTFFLEGSTARTNYDAGEESSRKFYGMGNYQVTEKKPGQIDIRIFGFLRKQTFTSFLDYGEGDCNGCGRDCNKVKNADPDNTEKIFQEHVSLKVVGNKFYLINKKTTQNLDFSTLELGLE